MRDILFQDFRALIDHRVQRSRDDFFIRDVAPVQPCPGAEVIDDFRDNWRRGRLALVIIVVKAGLGLLTPTPCGAKRILQAFDACRIAVPS